jgi:SAM-dependent methyltransferase
MDPDHFDHVTDPGWDLPVWRHLAQLAGGPALELGCGTGRVLEALCADGHDAHGVERDRRLAARAQARVGAGRVTCGDLRMVRHARPAALVIFACNTLSLFADPAPALAAAAAQLRPGSTLAFDLVVPAGRPWGRPPFTWVAETQGGTYDPQRGRHDGWSRDAGGGSRHTTWYRSQDAWRSLLQQAGLTTLTVVDRAGRPPDDRADTWVVIARRDA